MRFPWNGKKKAELQEIPYEKTKKEQPKRLDWKRQSQLFEQQ